MENPLELEAKRLSAEIHDVFLAVQEILPDLSQYPLGAKDPKWLSLERGSSNRSTVRDYVLQSYSAEQLGQPAQNIKIAALTCPLSFDITSNARTFEIDHFYPSDNILQLLDDLEDNQRLLIETKKELTLLFSGSFDPSSNKAIVDKLIPENSAGKLSVTGLRHIYFNYPKNLWPISGPTNSSKGKKASLKFAIEKIFESLLVFPGEPSFGRILSETASSIGLTLGSGLSVPERTEAICDALVYQFDIMPQPSGYILPSYYREDHHVVSMLEFFKASPVGNLATGYARVTAQQSLRSMRFARTIADSLMSPDPEQQNLGIGFAAASKVVDRTARRVLGTEDVSSDSDNPLDEISKKAMRFSADEILRVVEGAASITETHKEDNSNSVQKSKRKLSSMKEADATEDSTLILEDTVDNYEDEDHQTDTRIKKTGY